MHKPWLGFGMMAARIGGWGREMMYIVNCSCFGGVFFFEISHAFHHFGHMKNLTLGEWDGNLAAGSLGRGRNKD